MDSPTKRQREFRERLRDLYLVSEIHHPVGRTGKHNKLEIGHWWILAVHPDLHMALHQSSNRKQLEKETYQTQREYYEDVYGEYPVPDDIYQAIMDYHL